jgi:hypothetical protein
MPLCQRYADRVLLIGVPAGPVKATTGGGIYHGLLAVHLAVRPLPQGVRRTDIAGVRTRPALPLADELALGCGFASDTAGLVTIGRMASYTTSPAMGSKT